MFEGMCVRRGDAFLPLDELPSEFTVVEVVDGTVTMKSYRDEVIDGLTYLPATRVVSVEKLSMWLQQGVMTYCH